MFFFLLQLQMRNGTLQNICTYFAYYYPVKGNV